ncbi:hypothetical protein PF002_g17716 [Phytophthora fragariae]|uniref:Uncharacterized protein n=1 Tax=Phytophthora fragariae TaxID=53985 RepID=A0A6A3Y9D4_9STRA|nr:hypothetical protein PF002_g17716 [Phytophthora fragariae]
MGRRGVQQLTAAQWREALEHQIREKQQQEERAEDAGQSQRRSQSAPQQDDGEQFATVPGLERAATTASGEASDGQAAGRKRCIQSQSREDYLRGLQEQIEEKKRLAEEERVKERRRRRSRSEEDDANVGAAARRGACGESGECLNVDPREHGAIALQQRLEEAKATASSNQLEVEPCQTPLLKADPAADPVAITKIVDFCEELKKQNEDVKRQLLEQHAVLTSLHSTLEADGKASGSAPQRRGSKLRSSVDNLQVKLGAERRQVGGDNHGL